LARKQAIGGQVVDVDELVAGLPAVWWITKAILLADDLVVGVEQVHEDGQGDGVAWLLYLPGGDEGEVLVGFDGGI
jgi:hypothetical protein